MRTVLTAAVLFILASGVGAQAQSLLYSVPGVVNAGDLGTYFLCSSTDTATQTVSVEIFHPNGTSSGSGNYVLPAKGSVMFGTRNAAGLSVDVVTGALGNTTGLAEITSTSKGLICSAFIADAVNITPTFGANLSVVKKTKQKGD